MQKSKKKYYIGGAIVIIIIAIAVSLIFYLINKKDSLNLIPDITKDELSLEEIRTIFKNNYLISYILEGDVKTGDGIVTIDNRTYLAIEDELLEDFKTIKDVKTLIINTLRPELASTIINRLSDADFNQLFESNGHLYISKRKNVCEHPELKEENILYEADKTENNYIVHMGNYGDRIYINPALDNKYIMIALMFTCETIETQ